MRPKSSYPVPRSLRPGAGVLVLRLTIAAAAIAGTAILGGCTYYQTAPGVYSTTPPTPPSAFERSRNAALGAFEDQGVAIASADRGAGIIRGRRGGVELTADLHKQADGSVQVKFKTAGAPGQDPELVDRVSRSFDARMGR